MSVVYRIPPPPPKKNCQRPWHLHIKAMHIFLRPCHSKFMIFHAKIGILGKYLYVNHSLFYTVFRGKLYFI